MWLGRENPGRGHRELPGLSDFRAARAALGADLPLDAPAKANPAPAGCLAGD